MTTLWWKDLPDQTLMESVWEREMHLAAVEHHDRTTLSNEGSRKDSLTETGTGMKLASRYIKQTEAALKPIQMALINGNNRASRTARSTLMVVPAETVALLGVTYLLDTIYRATDQSLGVSYQLASKSIGKLVETELNFRTWVESSKDAARTMAQAQGLSKVPKSKAEWLIQESSVGLSEAAKRKRRHEWKKSFAELSTYEWTKQELLFCGEAVIHSITTACPEAFQRITPLHLGRLQHRVILTQTLRDTIEDREAQAFETLSFKKPMLTQPKRWTRYDPQ